MEITLTQGYKTIIDDEDFEYLNRFSWSAHKRNNGTHVYACTNINGSFVGMHQLLKGRYADHINHDTLDNRKENLRSATKQQNCFNQRKTSRITHSKFKGVSFKRTRKGTTRWVAYIRFDYKLIHLGTYDNERDAALAYNEKAKELFGEFANLNQV